MDHLAYYNVGCEPAPGTSRLTLMARRMVRTLLLPPSRRLVEILISLCHRLDVAEHEIRELREVRNQIDDLRRRQEEQAGRFPATIAFGWDYVAMVRRLAVLEEHVDSLLTARHAAEMSSEADDPSVRFPLDAGLEADHSPRSKVG
jgi:hypothetical protein